MRNRSLRTRRGCDAIVDNAVDVDDAGVFDSAVHDSAYVRRPARFHDEPPRQNSGQFKYTAASNCGARRTDALQFESASDDDACLDDTCLDHHADGALEAVEGVGTPAAVTSKDLS